MLISPYSLSDHVEKNQGNAIRRVRHDQAYSSAGSNTPFFPNNNVPRQILLKLSATAQEQE